MSFAGDIRAFGRKTGIRLDQVNRKVCLDVTRDLVMLNPVKSGLSRSNWFMGTNRVTTVSKAADPTGGPSLERAAAFATTLKAGGVFYIVNNLPYILQIMQYGSSTQAAPGAITKLVSDWQARINRIVAAL